MFTHFEKLQKNRPSNILTRTLQQVVQDQKKSDFAKTEITKLANEGAVACFQDLKLALATNNKDILKLVMINCKSNQLALLPEIYQAGWNSLTHMVDTLIEFKFDLNQGGNSSLITLLIHLFQANKIKRDVLENGVTKLLKNGALPQLKDFALALEKDDEALVQLLQQNLKAVLKHPQFGWQLPEILNQKIWKYLPVTLQLIKQGFPIDGNYGGCTPLVCVLVLYKKQKISQQDTIAFIRAIKGKIKFNKLYFELIAGTNDILILSSLIDLFPKFITEKINGEISERIKKYLDALIAILAEFKKTPLIPIGNPPQYNKVSLDKLENEDKFNLIFVLLDTYQLKENFLEKIVGIEVLKQYREFEKQSPTNQPVQKSKEVKQHNPDLKDEYGAVVSAVQYPVEGNPETPEDFEPGAAGLVNFGMFGEAEQDEESLKSKLLADLKRCAIDGRQVKWKNSKMLALLAELNQFCDEENIGIQKRFGQGES